MKHQVHQTLVHRMANPSSALGGFGYYCSHWHLTLDKSSDKYMKSIRSPSLSEWPLAFCSQKRCSTGTLGAHMHDSLANSKHTCKDQHGLDKPKNQWSMMWMHISLKNPISVGFCLCLQVVKKKALCEHQIIINITEDEKLSFHALWGTQWLVSGICNVKWYILAWPFI